MTATELLTDLTRLGIRLEAHGERLRFFPRAAVTPDLADRMKSHKSELLAALRSAGEIEVDTENAIEPIPFGPDDWPINTIEQPAPCGVCGGIEFWWNVLGRQRCEHCDPEPTRTTRIRELAARLRKNDSLRGSRHTKTAQSDPKHDYVADAPKLR